MFTIEKGKITMYRIPAFVLTASAAIALLAFAAFPAAKPASAQVFNFNFFKTGSYSQTGTGSPSLNSFYLDSTIFSENPTDATTATLTPGSGATINYVYDPTALNTPDGYPILNYGSPGYSTQADLDTAFPQGMYTVNYGGSGSTETPGFFSVDYSTDAYSGTVPVFDATTYNGLQNLNTSQPFTFTWNLNTPPTAANDPFDFLTLYNATTGAAVYSDGFLGANVTSDTIAANLLMPDTTYVADIDFSDRIDGANASVTDSNNNNIFVTQGFDLRTETIFTTANAVAVPEPSVFALLGLGLLPLGLIARRRISR